MIIQKDKLCKCGCGKMGKLFSKGMLLPCWNRNYGKPLKKSLGQVGNRKVAIRKVSDKKLEEKKSEKIETQKMQQMFLNIWDQTEDANGYCYCYETQTPMHRNYYRENTCCYHHLLEKGTARYEKYKWEEWNIVIVLPTVHTQAHGINISPRIKKLTEELKLKY